MWGSGSVDFKGYFTANYVAVQNRGGPLELQHFGTALHIDGEIAISEPVPQCLRALDRLRSADKSADVFKMCIIFMNW